MKYLIGFLAGLGAAWAALAIWQHRAVPDTEPDSAPDESIWYESNPGRRPPFDPHAPWQGDCTGFMNVGAP